MGKTGVQPSTVYLRSAAFVITVSLLLLLVSCGGSSNSAAPDTGNLSLSTSSLTFNYTIHELAQPAAQQIQVTSKSGSPIDFSATTDVSGTNWLSVQPANGIAPADGSSATLTVTALPSNLSAGTYTGHVIVVGQNSRSTATVTFKVVSTTAAIMDVTVPPAVVPPGEANPCQSVANCLLFTALAGSGNDPMPQLFSVKNDNTSSDPPDMQFSIAAATNAGGNWMDACISGTSATTCQSSGIATASVAIQPHVGSLAAGTYTGTVKVTSQGAVNSPTTVNVIFVVN